MRVINRSALVPFSAEQMFNLVDDIAAYPAFLPWCQSTNIIERSSEQVKASIQIAKAGINKTFSTSNSNHAFESIEMQLLDGPFKHLHGMWQFQQLTDKACKVSLDIEFEFSNGLLDTTLGPLFGHICNTMIEAFVKRAQEYYARNK